VTFLTKQSAKVIRKAALCEGFTLVELVVGLLLAVLVIGAAGSFIIFGTNVLSATKTSSEHQSDVTQVAARISEELRLAGSVQLVTNQPLPTTLGNDQRILFIGDESGNLAHTGYYFVQYGSLDNEPRNYFGSHWYGSSGVSLDYQAMVGPESHKSFEITVTAFGYNNQNTNISSTRSFELVNVTASQHPFYSAEINSTEIKFYLLYTVWQDEKVDDIVTADGDDPTDRNKEWVVPASGYYLLECWGADGGQIPTPALTNPAIQNGFGGYSAGTVYLAKDTSVYLVAGGAGQLITNTSGLPVIPGTVFYAVQGGFNGGGDSAQRPTSLIEYRTGGGGGSDIRVLQNSLNHRIIVSGGGGGNSSHTVAETAGNGGGLIGASGSLGTGGTQTQGGSSQLLAPSGPAGFGVGASSNNTVGGGGGGWYGGGNGNGAGGGSGYVLTPTSDKPAPYFPEHPSYYLSDTVNLQRSQPGYVEKPTNGHGGFVRITWIAR